MDPFSAATPACVCIYEPGNEMKTKTNIYRQNSWSHEGPADSPESVWLESDHHFNVLAKPLQTCVEKKKWEKPEKGDKEHDPGLTRSAPANSILSYARVGGGRSLSVLERNRGSRWIHSSALIEG